MKTSILIIFSAVVIFMSGCVAYYPQVVDIPLIQKKGDKRIDAGLFLAPAMDQQAIYVDKEDGVKVAGVFGAHGTYSTGITDVLAVQGYASLDFFGAYHLQGALGLYKAFENKNVVEWYSGYGHGNIWGKYPLAGRNNYHLPFTQLNFGKTNVGNRHIDYGLSIKGGYIFGNSDTWSNSEDYYQKDGAMIEPSVFFRFGKEKFKFSTKINYVWTNSFQKSYYYLPLTISMGVNISL